MKKLIILSIAFGLMGSCNSSNSKIKTTGTKYSSSDYDKAHKTPANQRTSEQNMMLEKLAKLVKENTVVENNHLVLKLSEKDFKRNDIPKEIYASIQNELIKNNKFIDSLHIDATQMLKDSKSIKKQ